MARSHVQLASPVERLGLQTPVIAAVFLVLFIVLWIGYTMATTPPPIPLENPLDLDSEGEEKKDKEEN